MIAVSQCGATEYNSSFFNGTFRFELIKQMQFKAGYIVDCIANVISDFRNLLDEHTLAGLEESGKISGLLKYVSSFEVEFPYPYNPNYKEIPPVLAVINNIITRGLPTRAPILLEETFAKVGLGEEFPDNSEKRYSSKIPIDFQTVFELLHIVEPGLNITREEYGGNLGSEGEWHFLNERLKDSPFAKQILQSQRNFATIGKGLAGGRSVDFSYEFPYQNAGTVGTLKKGVIFEFDGKHHKLKSYKLYDAYRDAVSDEGGFETLRQPSELLELDTKIENQFRGEIFRIFKKNFEREIDLAEYSILFIPLAAARIQKMLLEIFLSKPEELTKQEISIAIIERDLPCGAIAVKNFQQLFDNINALLDETDKLPLPKINLTIFQNEKWVFDQALHLDCKLQEVAFFEDNHFDIIIDHSILRRSDIYKERDYKHASAIKVRSSHYFDTAFGKSRRVYCADTLKYRELINKKDDGSYEPKKEIERHVDFFIQNIFRKAGFREGQLPIISRALQLKPVIGLLPTGGGKSLTYQLPVFLQPGLCVVADPIKSLMEDQVRVLKQNWIDCCDYINSNLNHDKTAKGKRLINFRYGETMFLFVSPERFVMTDFRQIIQTIDSSEFGLAFSYAVIDEVHCVSEWGHDFRSTYLMLGQNAQRFAKTRNGKAVSLIGLTATASFDVLADIERELRIDHYDVANAIIAIENTIRPELFFRVIDVTGKDRIGELNNDFAKISENLTKINNVSLLERSQKHHLQEFEGIVKSNEVDTFQLDMNLLLPDDELYAKTQDDFFSIVFCPVKGRKRNSAGEVINESGVDFVFNKIDSHSKGYYYGTSGEYLDEDGTSDSPDVASETQKHFERFTRGTTRHMVCTKAFGMGIDKKDVRTTYHYFYSGSLESLVQECGRSGRDKKISEANILISTASYWILDVFLLFSGNKSFELFDRSHLKIRKAIKQYFYKKWNEDDKKYDDVTFSTEEKIISAINRCPFALYFEGDVYYEPEKDEIIELRTKLLEKNGDGNYKYLIKKRSDRNIHDFFHNLTFKGIETEKNQLKSVFAENEVDGKFCEAFEACNDGTFIFDLLGWKESNVAEAVCGLLLVNPTHTNRRTNKNYSSEVSDVFKYSHDFDDCIGTLEEKGYFHLNERRPELEELYYKGRNKIDTGRLIYRMHSIGLLTDYEILYNQNNIHRCTFVKYESIGEYLDNIELYFRRYLSETSAIKKTKELIGRLNAGRLIDEILECLFFLTEFSYEETANKRLRATDEIETILHRAVTMGDWFDQNIYIKEEIFFYFNAKYARRVYRYENNSFSLLSDYDANKKKNNHNDALTKPQILEKYLGVYREDQGTDQNNYKHMIGSCKKILRSLSDTDLSKEWLLRLLKAFAMYSVNNASYISEANSELELGFNNLYNDDSFHKNDYTIIEPVFRAYFKKLKDNLQPDNLSFRDIEMIRLKLLLKLQERYIDKLIMQNQKLMIDYYA